MFKSYSIFTKYNVFLLDQNWNKIYDLEESLPSFNGLCKDLTRTPIYCALGEIEIRLNLKEYDGYSVNYFLVSI